MMNLKDVERHIEKTNEELGIVKITISAMKEDIRWLTKFQWLILTVSLGGFITVILTVLFR